MTINDTHKNTRESANRKALDNPIPGDYWHEMFCPYFLVTQVDGDMITVLPCFGKDSARKEVDSNSWEFDYSKHMIVDKEWIAKTVKYQTIENFVADVVRGSDKLNKVVEEWKRFHRERLSKELEKLA